MQQTQFLILLMLMSAMFTHGQRPSFAGSRPIGFPELYDLTTKADELGNRFGEGNNTTTTQRLPLEALGNKELVDRLSKQPVDNQPFWLINWQALEEQRRNPQTYPQKPNSFVPIQSTINNGNPSSGNQNTVPSPNGGIQSLANRFAEPNQSTFNSGNPSSGNQNTVPGSNGGIQSLANRFAEPNQSTLNSGNPISGNQNTVPGSNGGIQSLANRFSYSATEKPNAGSVTTEAVFGFADSEIGKVDNLNKNNGITKPESESIAKPIGSAGYANDGFVNIGNTKKDTGNVGNPNLAVLNLGNTNNPNIGTPLDYIPKRQTEFGITGFPNPGLGSFQNQNANSQQQGSSQFAVPTRTENIAPLNTNVLNSNSGTANGVPKVNNVVYNSMIKLHNEQPGQHGLPSDKSYNNHNSTLEVQRTDNPDKSWTKNWKYTWMNTYGYQHHFTVPPQPITFTGGQ